MSEENEFDINSFAAEFLSLQLNTFVDAIKDSAESVTQRLKLDYGKSLTTYIENLTIKSARSRSFFFRNDPVPLGDFYVPVGVSCTKCSIPRANASTLFSETPRAVVQGSGGCGKTVLTKFLLLDIIKDRSKVPIWVELRELNRDPITITKLILKSLQSHGLELSQENLERSLKNGIYCLLFDGFDELPKNLRNSVAKSILEIGSLSQNNWILVTSRPDQIFTGWNDFHIYSVSPLSLDQASELVAKTPINDELKLRFIEDLKRELFQKHSSFLSNPLLLSIMLLTYHDAANIPKKLSVFYSQAYESLFQKHDAWKGGYSRPRKTELDIHDFARVFAAFSILAYDQRVFSFTSSEALNLLKRAKGLTHLEYDESGYLEDAVQAVCLLVEDGLQTSYSHRSFQEYFAARFIADAPPALKDKLLKRVAMSSPRDSVLRLLHEMQPDFVETKFVLPRLTKLFKSLGLKTRAVSRDLHCRYLQSIFSEFRVVPESHDITAHNKNPAQELGHAVSFTIFNCGYLIGFTSFHSEERKEGVAEAAFWESQKGKKSYNIKSADLTADHPMVIMLYSEGKYFGARMPAMLWDICKKIRAKSHTARSSIEDLFKGTRRKQ